MAQQDVVEEVTREMVFFDEGRLMLLAALIFLVPFINVSMKSAIKKCAKTNFEKSDIKFDRHIITYSMYDIRAGP